MHSAWIDTCLLLFLEIQPEENNHHFVRREKWHSGWVSQGIDGELWWELHSSSPLSHPQTPGLIITAQAITTHCTPAPPQAPHAGKMLTLFGERQFHLPIWMSIYRHAYLNSYVAALWIIFSIHAPQVSQKNIVPQVLCKSYKWTQATIYAQLCNFCHIYVKIYIYTRYLSWMYIILYDSCILLPI